MVAVFDFFSQVRRKKKKKKFLRTTFRGGRPGLLATRAHFSSLKQRGDGAGVKNLVISQILACAFFVV